jgi:pyridoxamine 5'-phosphate oxidase
MHTTATAAPDTLHAGNTLADLRKNYALGELLEGQVAANPLTQLQTWLSQAIAAQVGEPNAMTLCSVAQGADGHWRPSSRIVLVKAIADTGAHAGLTWFTNYHSRKGQELAANPHACLQFHWVAQERQVRLEGVVARVSAADSDAYFNSRPLGSRIGAIASPQSEVIASRAALAQREAQLRDELGDDPAHAPARPAHWGGYRLRPTVVEFWQGRPNRLHDRLRYTLRGQGLNALWVIERLAP